MTLQTEFQLSPKQKIITRAVNSIKFFKCKNLVPIHWCNHTLCGFCVQFVIRASCLQ